MTPHFSTPSLAPGGPRISDARRLVRWISLWRPLRITADDAVSRSFAWQISSVWDASQKRWELQIAPGYVNGREVLCPAMPVDELPDETLDRIVIDGDPFAKTQRPWLSERPSIPVTKWRAVGTDATSLDGVAEEIPAYFLDRGVVAAEVTSTAGDRITTTQSATGDELRTQRLLRGVDIVLNQPRPAARLGVGSDNNPVVEITLPGSTDPYITIQPAKYDPAAEAGSIQAEFAGALTDDGIDRLRIGTLWLLSPEGKAHGSEPDETWSPYGQNLVFYHLDHATSRALDVIEPLDLGFSIPLAAGVAQLTISGITAEMQANDAYASAFLSKGRVTGTFWTI